MRVDFPRVLAYARAGTGTAPDLASLVRAAVPFELSSHIQGSWVGARPIAPFMADSFHCYSGRRLRVRRPLHFRLESI